MAANGTCVVCEGSLQRGKRAKEHVIPVWLQDDLGVARSTVKSKVIGLPDSVYDFRVNVPQPPMALKKDRQHHFPKLLAGNYCSECNNGWMSILEEETKPVLRRLLADPLATDVTQAEWLTIARWLLKTAFASEQSHSVGMVIVPPSHVRLVRDGKLPGGSAVFLSKSVCDRPDPFTWVNRDWVSTIGHRIDRRRVFEAAGRSYKATFHLRQLILTFAFVPPVLGLRVSAGLELVRAVFDNGVGIDWIPWSVSLPPGAEVGFFQPMSLLLSPGRYHIRRNESAGSYEHEDLVTDAVAERVKRVLQTLPPRPRRSGSPGR
jgi:hypothetical protein